MFAGRCVVTDARRLRRCGCTSPNRGGPGRGAPGAGRARGGGAAGRSGPAALAWPGRPGSRPASPGPASGAAVARRRGRGGADRRDPARVQLPGRGPGRAATRWPARWPATPDWPCTVTVDDRRGAPRLHRRSSSTQSSHSPAARRPGSTGSTSAAGTTSPDPVPPAAAAAGPGQRADRQQPFGHLRRAPGGRGRALARQHPLRAGHAPTPHSPRAAARPPGPRARTARDQRGQVIVHQQLGQRGGPGRDVGRARRRPDPGSATSTARPRPAASAARARSAGAAPRAAPPPRTARTRSARPVPGRRSRRPPGRRCPAPAARARCAPAAAPDRRSSSAIGRQPALVRDRTGTDGEERAQPGHIGQHRPHVHPTSLRAAGTGAPGRVVILLTRARSGESSASRATLFRSDPAPTAACDRLLYPRLRANGAVRCRNGTRTAEHRSPVPPPSRRPDASVGVHRDDRRHCWRRTQRSPRGACTPRTSSTTPAVWPWSPISPVAATTASSARPSPRCSGWSTAGPAAPRRTPATARAS